MNIQITSYVQEEKSYSYDYENYVNDHESK